PPALVTDVFVPASVTSPEPEMNDTVGAALVAQTPIALIQPAGTSPTRLRRRRPVRNCGTLAAVTTALPPRPVTDAHGSEGVTTSVAVRASARYVAVTMTLPPTAEGVLATANVAVVAPSAMVTLVGTPTSAGSALVRVTSAPPAGAAAVSVSRP